MVESVGTVLTVYEGGPGPQGADSTVPGPTGPAGATGATGLSGAATYTGTIRFGTD